MTPEERRKAKEVEIQTARRMFIKRALVLNWILAPLTGVALGTSVIPLVPAPILHTLAGGMAFGLLVGFLNQRYRLPRFIDKFDSHVEGILQSPKKKRRRKYGR